MFHITEIYLWRNNFYYNIVLFQVIKYNTQPWIGGSILEGKSLTIGIIIGLLILSAPSYILYSKLTTTQNKLNQDHENLTRCNQDKNILQSNITKLKQEYNKLMSGYNQLKNNYQQLQGRFRSLNTNYTTTMDLYNKLKQTYNDLLGNYSKLKENYNTLQTQYRDLENNYAVLQNEATQLKQNYQTLNSTYNQLLDEYNNLVQAEMKSQNWVHMFYSSQNESSFYINLLNESAKSINNIDQAPLFIGTPIKIAFSVFNYTLANLYYCYDSYVREVNLTNNELYVRQDAIMLPNETWSNRCGDCEDLALFDYSLLSRVANSNMTVYYIEFHPKEWKMSHASLLVVLHENNSKKYIIVDPAGNYFNGLSMRLILDIKDTYGQEWWYWIDPIGISNDTKYYLFYYKLAVIKYYDNFNDKYYSLNKVPIHYYASISDALNDWLVSYWKAYHIDYMLIVGPNVFEEFHTMQDAENWISNYG